MQRYLFTSIAWLTITSTVTFAQQATPDFDRDIRPILADNCYHCHGPDPEAREADLRLDTKQGLFSKHDDTTIVAPGKPSESDLIRRISSDDEFTRMPPVDSNRTLSPAEIKLLTDWVAAGARWSGHWAWQAPERPALPQVNDATWTHNPIDRFILARLEQEGLAPQTPADKQTLLRRVTLDLTGLPPTPAQTKAFLADDSPGAYDRVVNRLLDSPAYGERMAWDWLDAARYADTNGYQGDPERPMWPWRDWAVDAFNSNMPFDQFTIEQLAGDQLPDASPEQILATGFNRNHMHNGEGGRIAEETRVENVMDRVETTSTVWLGATVGCARCHDHKFDPFTQREYYQLYAFFNNTSENGRGRGAIPPVLSYAPPTQQRQLQEFESEIEQSAVAVEAIESDHAKAQGEHKLTLSEEHAKLLDKSPQQRTADHLKQLRDAVKEQDTAYHEALDKLLSAVNHREGIKSSLPKVMVMDTLAKRRQSHILVKGAYDKPADPVTVGTPAVFPPLSQSSSEAKPNRLALARWLVDRQHPLTARVTVNRYWQLFFGTGLVKTAEDFGTQGEKPSHAELLDWLAVEFMQSGWDVKQMHRLMVTSATYRQSSAMTAESHERDPHNRLLARGPRYRLPSWMIRDQALAAAGLLVPELGGSPVKPYQPEGIWAEATFGKKRYNQDSGADLYRRSLYTFWRRIVGPTMFFDSAARQTCVVGQTRTNTPLHALVTLNDITYVEAARALAGRVMVEVPAEGQAEGTAAARLERAYRLLLARSPSEDEAAILLTRLEAMRERYTADPAAATGLLSIGASSREESLPLADHAAWTTICSLLLNLDETLNKQ